MAGFNQLGRQLSTGIGSFFSDSARQKGEMAGLQQVALEDQIDGGRLKMDAIRQDLDLKRQEAVLKTPQAAMSRVRQALGIPTQAEPEVQQYLDSGRIDKYQLGAGQAGPTMEAPAWASPGNLSKFGQFFAADQAVQAGSAKSAEDYFKGMTESAVAGLTSRTADGSLPAQQAGARFYAIKGGKPFDFNEYGAGNNYTGVMDGSQAAPLYVHGKQADITLRGAQTAAQKANAAQSYAAAENSRASATQTRNAPKGTLVQTPDGPVFANPVTGEATPVTVAGQRVKGGTGKGGGAMSATLQKELIEADDVAGIADQTVATLTNALALNDKAYSGMTANLRAKLRSNLPGDSPEADATVNLNNMIGEQALSGMKAIFGGNPTEGERAILLELQASSDKTPAQRKAIIERGITLAKRRATINRERAKSIRSGTYLTEGADDVPMDNSAAPDPVADALKKYGGG